MRLILAFSAFLFFLFSTPSFATENPLFNPLCEEYLKKEIPAEALAEFKARIKSLMTQHEAHDAAKIQAEEDASFMRADLGRHKKKKTEEVKGLGFFGRLSAALSDDGSPDPREAALAKIESELLGKSEQAATVATDLDGKINQEIDKFLFTYDPSFQELNALHQHVKNAISFATQIIDGGVTNIEKAVSEYSAHKNTINDAIKKVFDGQLMSSWDSALELNAYGGVDFIHTSLSGVFEDYPDELPTTEHFIATVGMLRDASLDDYSNNMQRLREAFVDSVRRHLMAP